MRFKGSSERFARLGLPWGTGNALSGIAWAELAGGNLDGTDRALADTVTALSSAGPWFSLLVLYVRAVLAVRRGRPEEAIAFVRESLAGVHELHDKFALLYALAPLAAAAEMIGDDAWAARILAARDAVTERTGAVAVDDSVRDLRERVERDPRARLGQRRWAREYAAGRNATVKSMLDDIDNRSRRAAIASSSGGG